MDEKQKLKIVKYNKTFQNYTNIHLTNYKFFTGKYIIYESNGKGKEYDGSSDNLIFEGEYLNGERNGKGKEYYGDKVVFEGEYLNGKRNGKGKYYYYNMIYEEEYLNGVLMSKKIHDDINNIIIEFKNDNENTEEEHYHQRGYGDCVKVIFDGEYLNGKRNGKGKEYYDDGKRRIFIWS